MPCLKLGHPWSRRDASRVVHCPTPGNYERIRTPRMPFVHVGHAYMPPCRPTRTLASHSLEQLRPILSRGISKPCTIGVYLANHAAEGLLCWVEDGEARKLLQKRPRRRAASLLEGHEPPRAARARRAPQGCATAPTRRRRAARAASPLHRCAVAPMTQTRLARAASSTFASSQANKQP